MKNSSLMVAAGWTRGTKKAETICRKINVKAATCILMVIKETEVQKMQKF
jgi:hypothetical protein